MEGQIDPARWSGYGIMGRHVAPANAHLLDLLPEGRGRLLDIGSGTGAGLDLARRRGWSPVGLDRSADQLRAATDIDEPQVRADAAVLPFEAETLDAALSNFGLIFASDPTHVLAEAHRCLRPGSPLAFTAWAPGGWPEPCREILASALGRAAPSFPTDLGTPVAAERVLDACGFDVTTAMSGALRWNFDDLDHAIDTLTTAAGGLRVLREAAEAAGVWPTARRHLEAELADHSMRIDTGIAIDDRYLAIVGRR